MEMMLKTNELCKTFKDQKASVKLCVKCLEGTTERSDSNRGRSPRMVNA